MLPKLASQVIEYPEPIEALTQLSFKEELDIDEAIKILSEKVQKDHELVDEYIDLGKLFRRKGEYRKSFALLRNLLVRNGLKKIKKSRVYAEMGYNYLLSKTRDFGESLFIQAQKLDRNSLYIQEGLYQSYRRSGQYQKAADTLTKITHTRPERRMELVYLLSKAALEKLRLKETGLAKKMVAAAQKVGVESPFLHLSIAEIQSNEKKWEDAVKTLEELIFRWPNSTLFALRKIENVYYEMNEYSKYAYSIRKCLQKNPQNYFAHHALGKYLVKIKKTEEALEHFEKAIELYPLSIQSLKEVIEIHLQKESPESALEILETFLSADPNQKNSFCPLSQGTQADPNCTFCSKTEDKIS